MEYKEMLRRETDAIERDPRSAAVGYHISDTVCGTVCRFEWFDSVEALVAHLREVHVPECEDFWSLSETARKELDELLKSIEVNGLNEADRIALSDVVRFYDFPWWGSFEDLLTGKTQFSREILGSFAVKQGGGRGVDPEELPEFVRYMRICCDNNFGTCADVIPVQPIADGG